MTMHTLNFTILKNNNVRSQESWKGKINIINPPPELIKPPS
jgi:hypothetical protein